MNRLTFPRSDLRWLVAVFALLALPWVLPDLNPSLATDSFQTGIRGKKAFYRILERSGYFEVQRNHESLPSLLSGYAGSEPFVVLCFLGPARNPTEQEWRVLHDFVEEGGAILFAAPPGTQNLEIPAFGINGTLLTDAIDYSPDSDAMLQTDLGPLEGQFTWKSGREWTFDSTGQTILSVDESPQAVLVEAGDGAALFVATDTPFENYMLSWPDNALLATRLFEQVGDRPVVILDERLNATGVPKVVSLLLDQPLRNMSLHVLALLTIFGWWRSRRFGPLLPPHEPERSDIVDHANGMGLLFFRTRDGVEALRMYLDQFRLALHLQSLSRPRDLRILEPLARRAGRPLQEVQALFRAALIATKEERLDRATAARHIRELAKLRGDFRHPPRRED